MNPPPNAVHHATIMGGDRGWWQGGQGIQALPQGCFKAWSRGRATSSDDAQVVRPFWRSIGAPLHKTYWAIVIEIDPIFGGSADFGDGLEKFPRALRVFWKTTPSNFNVFFVSG